MAKSGFVTLVGRPNVGKSTLINRLVKNKIAITSPRPQTTRNRIVGVLHEPDCQIVFVDTPGVARNRSKLTKSIVDVSIKASLDNDALLFITDAYRPDAKEDIYVLNRLKSKAPVMLLAINKIDLVKKETLLEQIKSFESIGCFNEIIPISAMSGENVDELLTLIRGAMPDGPMYYPKGMVTDQPEEFIIGEIIREKAILRLKEELPYSIAVSVDMVEDRSPGLTAIAAVIFVERESQKGIVIGKNGAMLKEIGSASRLELEKRLKSKIYLDLFVKVKEKWTENQRNISDFGYGIQK